MKGQLRRPFSTLIGSTNMFICLSKHVNLLSTHFAIVTLDIKYMHSFPEDPSFDISKEMYLCWLDAEDSWSRDIWCWLWGVTNGILWNVARLDEKGKFHHFCLNLISNYKLWDFFRYTINSTVKYLLYFNQETQQQGPTSSPPSASFALQSRTYLGHSDISNIYPMTPATTHGASLQWETTNTCIYPWTVNEYQLLHKSWHPQTVWYADTE